MGAIGQGMGMGITLLKKGKAHGYGLYLLISVLRTNLKLNAVAVEIITKEDLQQFRIQLIQDIKLLMQPGEQPSKKEWLKGSEVRKLLKISQGTLQNLRISGKLHPSKIGSIYYYPLEEVNKLLANTI